MLLLSLATACGGGSAVVGAANGGHAAAGGAGGHASTGGAGGQAAAGGAGGQSTVATGVPVNLGTTKNYVIMLFICWLRAALGNGVASRLAFPCRCDKSKKLKRHPPIASTSYFANCLGKMKISPLSNGRLIQRAVWNSPVTSLGGVYADT